MTLLKIISLFFLLTFVKLSTCSNVRRFPNCKISYSFAKVCHFYSFDNVCVPWNTTSCQKLKSTRNDFKCPKYICSASTTQRSTTTTPKTTTQPSTTTTPKTSTSTTTVIAVTKTATRQKLTAKPKSNRGQKTTVKPFTTSRNQKVTHPKKVKPSSTTARSINRRINQTLSPRLPSGQLRQILAELRLRTSTTPRTTITTPETTLTSARLSPHVWSDFSRAPLDLVTTTGTQATTQTTTTGTTTRQQIPKGRWGQTLKPNLHGNLQVENSRTVTVTMDTTTSTSSLFSPAIRAKRSDVDCGSKICFLSYQVVENCYLYIHTNSTECEIPCKLKGCRIELHHFVTCPIWHCHDVVVTTTTSTTTTSASTSTTATTTDKTSTPTTTITTATTTDKISTATTTIWPQPSTLSPLPPLDHPGYLYSSFALNILLMIFLIVIAIKKCKKAIIRKFRNRRRNSTANVENGADGSDNPILRNPNRILTRENRSRSRIAQNEQDRLLGSTSSSEDFGTSETIAMTSRLTNIFASSPRVPSFLDTPLFGLSPAVDPADARRARPRLSPSPSSTSTFNPNPRGYRRSRTDGQLNPPPAPVRTSSLRREQEQESQL